MMEQKLLISLLKPQTSKEQKIYKQRTSFYGAIWKLRDLGLVTNTEMKLDGTVTKIWRLTLDGMIMARILSKEKTEGKRPKGKDDKKNRRFCL
jgi:hypothetical protein